MSKQTAMKEMHDWLVDKWSDPSKLISCLEVINKIEELLPKEKQQIIDFADKYAEYSYRESMNNRYISPTTAEQYYNETYGNAKV
jgi:hypothetical protein